MRNPFLANAAADVANPMRYGRGGPVRVKGGPPPAYRWRVR